MLIVVFILAIAAVSIIPNYITQQWPWNNSPDVPNLEQLKKLQREGLELPGWTVLEQQTQEIGGHKWSVQAIKPIDIPFQPPSDAPIWLMLRPQTWHQDQPQVDWMDINGVKRWNADSQRHLDFTTSTPDARNSTESSVGIQARFFRGWNYDHTYAVLQWYAWSTGGHPSPGRWFWADQLSQWRDRHRMPWVAVSLLVPIKPLGDIDSARSLIESLGQTVQTALMANVLNPKP
jgi:cyanoexosortase B-associated protein